ncbi:PAS domain S-box protein [Thiovibrio sp. JS02]
MTPSKGNILIVDDEPIVLKLLAMQVMRLGYGAETAGSGQEALAFLGGSRFDLLITDIMMPGMDGLSLMQQAKAVQPDLECIVVSGQAEVSIAVEAMKLGAINYIQKPVAMLELDVSLSKGMERLALLRDLRRNQLALQAAARDLSAETEKNRMILDAAGEGIVGLDAAGKITLMNPAAMQMLGVAPEDVPGKAFSQFLPTPPPDEPPANDSPPLWNPPARQMAGASLRRRDGSELSIEYISSPIIKEGEVAGSVLVFTDISERKKAELALQKSEAQLRTLMQSTQVGIFLYRDDKIIFANPVLEAITGYSVEECRTMRNWGFIHPDHLEMVREYGRQLIRGQALPRRYEVKILTKFGEVRWLDFLVNLISLDGRQTGMVSFIDISERKNIEQELDKYQRHLELLVEERTAELARINEQLQEDIKARKKAEKEAEERRQQLIEADKMVSLGILVAGVAHEINNPNNFITMNAPILLRAWEDFQPILERHYREEGDFPVAGIPFSEMREHIPELFSGILDGSERIRRIVLNLRDYARQGISDMEQTVELNNVVRAALVLLASPLKKATHRLTVAYGENIPPVKGNFQRAEQVVINLIQNAYQALPGPEKSITISTGYDGKSDRAFVEVLDQGCGISTKNLKRIQDPFFTTKRDNGGSGLGLSISAGIMEEHGGKLEFISEPGKGTRARALFPPAAAPENTPLR